MNTEAHSSPSMGQRIILLLLTLAGFALRLAYALHSHPFVDEFTTVLAAKAILQRGLPILPSGLFYEHGILFSYLDAPFVALANTGALFTLARLPSLLIGTAMIPLLYWMGRRWFSPWVGLGAAALFAFSPEGMVWGGRARMYALAQLLVLLIVFWAFAGTHGKNATRHRWLALATLLLALLAHFGTLMFVPPTLIGIAVIWWLSRREKQRAHPKLGAWLAQGIALIAVIGAGMLVKRLGQPLGMAQLGDSSAANPLIELWHTLSYQIGIALDGESVISFLARQFGVPHHVWLTVGTVLGAMFAGLDIRRRNTKPTTRSLAYLFLWLAFGLTIIEMITLLEPFRRNPRYVVMGLPLFYLLAAQSIAILGEKLSAFTHRAPIAIALIVTVLQLPGAWQDVNIAYRTPEPAYDRAFQFVAAQWQPDDAVLTVHPPAAALYLPRVDYFAQQRDADQFLLNRDSAPVDRWLGLPWLSSTAEFIRILNANPRVWFIADEQRLTTFGFFEGDWLAVLNTQMEKVWTEDGAVVYRTRANRIPIPDAPDTRVEAEFGGIIRLEGYSINTDNRPPRLTLFWQALAPIPADYTIFIHLRDANNASVQQWDRQPLDGAYPTHLWQPGETLTDPLTLTLPNNLPPGNYRLAIGLYRLDTMERLPLAHDTSGENALFITEDLWP